MRQHRLFVVDARVGDPPHQAGSTSCLEASHFMQCSSHGKSLECPPLSGPL